MASFNPSAVKTFRFVSYSFDEKKSLAEFCYAFDNGPRFIERLTFHNARPPADQKSHRALFTALRYLHLVLGVSYYKAAVPGSIRIETAPISEPCAHFFDKLYLHGLAEFAYRNQLDLRKRIRFPFSTHSTAVPESLQLPKRTAIPVGGGKDAVVTIDALKRSGQSPVLFALGDFQPIRAIAGIANLPLISVTRQISPALIQLNEQGAYNGHVPISAIIAFVLPVCAILYGFDTAALSNERSANSGNLVHNGLSVNHQYSKSMEFETDAALFFKRNILSDFKYFSFLRPFSDLRIAQLFSQLNAYHPVFMSCNRAFRLDRQKRLKRWCLDCPKCRFTFLVLAPFLHKSELIALFGKNLLDDFEQRHGFDRLLGVGGFKPFECVGETGESAAAFILLAQNSQWRNACLVQRFKTKILPGLDHPQRLVKTALAFSDLHQLPFQYEEVLRAYSGT